MPFPVPLSQKFLELAAHCGIRSDDIDEFFTHGHGHGGQKINKTESCVELTHKPTGITVRHQHHREQHLNRLEAYELLIQKIGDQAHTLEAAKAHEEYVAHWAEHHRHPRHLAESMQWEKKHEHVAQKQVTDTIMRSSIS
ncbi:MAG: peptide chain release factor-like protein [Candidatus Peregrinibacteria bacterium]